MRFQPYSTDPDCVVVGGGLAGLFAAALVARAGRAVFLFGRAGKIGGLQLRPAREFLSISGPMLCTFGACIPAAARARRILHKKGSRPGKDPPLDTGR